MVTTYHAKKHRHRSKHSKPEDQRQNNGRVLRPLPERVVDVLLLAISQLSLCDRPRQLWVMLDLDVEERLEEAGGFAEGGDEQGRLQAGLGQEELGGEVFVALWVGMARSAMAQDGGGGGGFAVFIVVYVRR